MTDIQDLKAKWITDYEPAQDDYAELFDFIETKGGILKKVEKSFELRDFSTAPSEVEIAIPEAKMTMAESPGLDRINVIQKAYVSAKLTPPYQLQDNELVIDIFQGGVRISTKLITMTDLVLSTVMFEFDVDYGGNMTNFANGDLDLSL